MVDRVSSLRIMADPVDICEPAASTGRWRQYDGSALPAPLAAALEVFAEQGYHGTTIRQVAGRAGLSVPGLYHHYPSKQALLAGIVDASMDELLSRSFAAEREAGVDPLARYDAVIESLLRFHMHRRDQAFVTSSELRSLEPAARARHIDQRDRQQRQVDEIVVDGANAGVFAAEYPLDAARAAVTMCVAVASWYRPSGSMSVDQLVSRYAELARRLVGYRSS